MKWDNNQGVHVSAHKRDAWAKSLVARDDAPYITYTASGDSIVVVHHADDDGAIYVYDCLLRRTATIWHDSEDTTMTITKTDDKFTAALHDIRDFAEWASVIYHAVASHDVFHDIALNKITLQYPGPKGVSFYVIFTRRDNGSTEVKVNQCSSSIRYDVFASVADAVKRLPEWARQLEFGADDKDKA